MRIRELGSIVSVMFALHATAANEITVEKSTVGCQANRWTTIGQFDAGAAIAITGIESDWTAIRIRPTTTSTTPAIGRVTLGVSTLPSNGLDVFIASIECLPDNSDLTVANAGSTWAGLTYASGSESLRDRVRLVAAISGNLTGSVDAGSIFRLQVGGDIIAPVAASSFWFSEPGIQHLVCTQVLNDGTTTHGSIIASTGDIGVVEIDTELSGGELRGPVHASGTISRLIVGGPITIAASPGIQAGGGINEIKAASFDGEDVWQPIDATIVAGGELRALRCGDLIGSVTALNIPNVSGTSDPSNAIVVNGDLDGSIVVQGDSLSGVRVHGDMLPGSSIRVAGSCAASILIDGDATEIIVEGQVSILSASTGHAIEIGSSGGSVERIALGSAPPDTTRLGYEVVLRGSHIELIEIGEFAQGAGCSFQLEAPSIGSLISASGGLLDILDLEAFDLIQIDGDWSFEVGSVIRATSGLVRVGGDLNAPIEITQPLAFDGLIISNAWNQIDPRSSAWTGEVYIDSIALSPRPDYDQTRFDFAGAVGVVPFHLHKADCEPPHAPEGTCDSSFPTRTWPSSHGGGVRQTIILRHYGPVFDSLDNTPKPVIVLLKSLFLCSPTPCPGAYGELTDWTDRTTYFDVHVPPGGREVWIARELDGTTPQPLDFGYRFTIELVEHEGVTQLRSGATFLADEDAPGIGGYPYILDVWCEALWGPTPPPGL